MSRPVSETPVAHFSLRWEAEFARGFLTDAGIPARITDEGGAGIGAYMGDAVGCTVFVAEVDHVRARETLEAAGVLESAAAIQNRPPALLDRELPPVLRADAEDVTEALRLARRAETRHGLFALLGVSPAAILPMLGLLRGGSEALVIPLCLLVMLTEGWKWIAAGREARRLEALLLEFEETAEEGD